MNILLVGHKNRLQLIEDVISRSFKSINYECLEYLRFEDTEKICGIIEKKQVDFDVILYTGEVPYQYIKSRLKPVISSSFLAKDKVALLIILFRILKKDESNIKRVSFDTYNKELINHVYRELGFDIKTLKLKFCNVKSGGEENTDKIFEFHKSNYESGKITCCVTALNNIYERLKVEKIPCYILNPSNEIIKRTLEKLMLKYMAKINKRTKIIVISIYIDYPHDHSITNTNEYQSFKIRSKVADKVYLFVHRIQAAVVHESSNQFILFSTKELLESATDNYKSIELLHHISKEYASNISIGIGHGITAREAKYNATLGMNKAKSHNQNTAYVICEGEEIIGPITQYKTSDNNKIMRDVMYEAISTKTGISAIKVFKMHVMIEKYQKNTFISKEFADELTLSIRSINKIITKLEDANLVEIIGHKYKGNSGRPSRLIKLLF